MTEMKAPRDAIGKALIQLAEKNFPITVIDCDLASSTRADQFAKNYPERFFEMGIAEASSLSFAAGQSFEGLIPFFIDFAIFATGTVWTQLRQSCYANANIKIVGTHPGVDGGFDGASHHALEDIALTRVLPNLTVLSPADADEVYEAFEQAAKIKGPVYIRVAREPMPIRDKTKVPRVNDIDAVIDEGNDFAIIFEGASYEQANDGYQKLTSLGYKGKLIHLACIKPFNQEKFKSLCQHANVLITVENHSINGGVGGLIAEQSMQNCILKPLIRIGVPDTFTESGKSGQLKDKYGISGQNICDQFLKVLS